MVISVIIPAHNEAAVLGRCLKRLLDDAEPGEFEVIVVPNGCTDGTAEVARSFPGVSVVELPASSKTAALNAGEELATCFPRIYLDADIQLTTTCARALVAAVTAPDAVGVTRQDPVAPPPVAAAPGAGRRPGEGRRARPPVLLAAAPRRALETTGRPLLVRAYYAVNSRLPTYRGSLVGRGAIAVSEAGRARFDRYPETFADDLYLDSIYRPEEKGEVSTAAAVALTPRRTRDLLRRLGRVRAANTALRGTDGRVPPARGGSWLVDVVLPRPWLLPAAACYLALTLLAEVSALRTATRATWGRDESSRAATGDSPR